MTHNKQVHIIGGGTIYKIRPHLELAATAYGGTARRLYKKAVTQFAESGVNLHLTRMADRTSSLETASDIAELFSELRDDMTTKVVFVNAAVVDFEAEVVGNPTGRLSSKQNYQLNLSAAPKLINMIRREKNSQGVVRKDILLVATKATAGLSEQEQYLAGLDLVKRSSANLVLANDVETGLNMIITPEEAAYHVIPDRDEALNMLMDMAYLRSQLTFTRSTVVSGEPVTWDSKEVPEVLRTVVDHCIEQNAYKAFNGATVGHFACALSETEFLTSIRKSNFNDLASTGLVRVKTDGPDTVLAFGAKPSVGGQSQRIIFREHEGNDCIVHFHCEQKKDSLVPVRSQREYECGSHQCGQNTSDGLQQFGNLKAVFLDQHGPNIVFPHTINPQEVIDFIEANFDLETKTGGFQLHA